MMRETLSFAKKYNLPIKMVIEGGDESSAYIGDGKLINSVNSQDPKQEAKSKLLNSLKKGFRGEENLI